MLTYSLAPVRRVNSDEMSSRGCGCSYAQRPLLLQIDSRFELSERSGETCISRLPGGNNVSSGATAARLVDLSRYYFCRAFKQSFGVPPRRYHANRRTERAKAMLLDPDQSVSETAFALGFSDTSSFSTAFGRATGCTPTEYRRAFE